MPPVLQTRFDKPLEDDVELEHSKGVDEIKETLKNAENTYKAFLYLRKMYSLFPNRKTVLKMEDIDSDDFVEIDKPENANNVLVSNTGDNNCFIKINGDQFTIMPGKDFEFPIIPKTDDEDGDKLEFRGRLSYCMKNIQEF